MIVCHPSCPLRPLHEAVQKERPEAAALFVVFEKDMKTKYDFIVWIGSCLGTILGVVNAALSEQPLFWLAVWPMPVTFASAIFVFVRQGFHLEEGVLVLGRRRRAIR